MEPQALNGLGWTLTLKQRFALDEIEPVGKGQLGADLIQRVITQSGQIAGTIIWECKRTKNWSADWLSKLRADQRAAGAEIAVLVSQARKDVDTFSLVDGFGSPIRNMRCRWRSPFDKVSTR